MKTKMNLNVVAETEEEKSIEEYLKLLHNSNEVASFLQKMKEEAESRNVLKYRARIKDVDSAIRTYRINNKDLQNAHDYIGISFITNTEDDIYPIIDGLKKELPENELINFVSEESIYSPLVYIKWVPPLSYNIFAKKQIIPKQMKVPIEIRVCSKEGYISEQAAYYSVQKNDLTGLPIEQKNNLRNIMQHITYKLALLNLRNLNSKEYEKHSQELLNLINENKEFLEANNDICKDAILDFGQMVYKSKYDKEYSEDKEKLSKEEIDNIEDYLKNKFCALLESGKGDLIKKVTKAIQELCKIEYTNIKQEAL